MRQYTFSTNSNPLVDKLEAEDFHVLTGVDKSALWAYHVPSQRLQ